MPQERYFKRGETLTIALEDLDADYATIAAETVSAVLKAAVEEVAVPPDAAPVVATFVVAARPADGDVGPGWNLSLSVTQTAALPIGVYVTNVSIAHAGGTVTKTDPLFLRIVEATQ